MHPKENASIIMGSIISFSLHEHFLCRQVLNLQVLDSVSELAFVICIETTLVRDKARYTFTYEHVHKSTSVTKRPIK